jgi:hypothetical protein
MLGGIWGCIKMMMWSACIWCLKIVKRPISIIYVDMVMSTGDTPLHYELEKTPHYFDTVQKMLRWSKNPAKLVVTQNNEGNTPLHLHLLSNTTKPNPQIIKLMIETNDDVILCKNNEGQIVAHLIIATQNPYNVALMMNKLNKHDILALIDGENKNLMHYAIENSMPDRIVKQLAAMEPKLIDQIDNAGHTPYEIGFKRLFAACYEGIGFKRLFAAGYQRIDLESLFFLSRDCNLRILMAINGLQYRMSGPLVYIMKLVAGTEQKVMNIRHQVYFSRSLVTKLLRLVVLC